MHQTALYDMIWCAVLLGILLLIDRKPRNRGFLFLTWASLYGLGRIATDFARIDKTWFGTGLTGSQLTSLAAVAICLFFLIRYRGVPVRTPAVVEPLAPAKPIAEPQVEPEPLVDQPLPGMEPWVEPTPPGEGYVDVSVSEDD